MIPQSAVSKKRTNAQGDFHVCRKCNTEKSKIDDLFGLLSRINLTGESGEEAIAKLARMLSKGDKRIIAMLESAKQSPQGVEVRLPLKGEDVYKYGVFLTKGEYFKQNGEILDLKRNIVLVKWGGPNLVKKLLCWYGSTHGKDPYHDLTLNSGVENINKECFIVAEKGASDFIFLFNRAYVLLTEILEYTAENRLKKKENMLGLIEGLSKNITNEYCV